MDRSCCWLLLATALPFLFGGATCMPRARGPVATAPVLFTAPPTLSEIMAAINANTARIRQLETTSASLSIAGLPAIRASIAAEPPRRLRLKAKMFGPEADLGSNEELFWFWTRQDPSKAFYYARHETLAQIRPAQPLPLDPEWVLAGLGLVRFDEHVLHEGPFQQGPYVEIRSHLVDATGQRRLRTLQVDGTYGWIVQQTMHDERGQVLAKIQLSDHRYDPSSGTTLPHRMAVELPHAGLAFQLDVDQYVVNQLLSDPAELWTPPQIEGTNLVNLADPWGGTAAASQGWQSAAPPPRAGFRPRYRGYTQTR